MTKWCYRIICFLVLPCKTSHWWFNHSDVPLLSAISDYFLSILVLPDLLWIVEDSVMLLGGNIWEGIIGTNNLVICFSERHWLIHHPLVSSLAPLPIWLGLHPRMQQKRVGSSVGWDNSLSYRLNPCLRLCSFGLPHGLLPQSVLLSSLLPNTINILAFVD